MGPYEKLFNAGALDDQKLGEIEFVLTSPAYDHSFRPFVESLIKSLERLWRDPSRQRKDLYPDDYLRGGVDFGEAMLNYFEALVRETSMDRVHRAMENMTPEMLYRHKLEHGQMQPVVGLDQQPLPERPIDPAEEDF